MAFGDVQTFGETDGAGPVFSFGSLRLRCTYVSLTVFLRHGFVVVSKNCRLNSNMKCEKKLYRGRVHDTVDGRNPAPPVIIKPCE